MENFPGILYVNHCEGMLNVQQPLFGNCEWRSNNSPIDMVLSTSTILYNPDPTKYRIQNGLYNPD